MKFTKYIMAILVVMAGCNSEPDDSVKNTGVYIYPNPATDYTNITVRLGIDATVEIIDSEGESFQHQSIHNDETLGVNLASRPSGIFHVIVESRRGTVTQQFIKL